MIQVKILDLDGNFVDYGWLQEPEIRYGNFGKYSTQTVLSFSGRKFSGTECIIYPIPKLLTEGA